MSFHPLMVYDRDHFHRSERARLDEGGTFVFTPERRATLDELLTKYPPTASVRRCSRRSISSRNKRDT